MKHWIRRYATWRVGVSLESAEDLFGARWQDDGRTCVIHCGLDLSKFTADEVRGQVRRSVGLPADALVIGHVGRFYPRKNHSFLLDVAAELFALTPHASLLSLGDGPLMPEIQARAKALGIAERIVFAGSRNDVAALMMNAMDVFMLPSYQEGLSIALLEAQAAGLPCVISDRFNRGRRSGFVDSPLVAGCRASGLGSRRAARRTGVRRSIATKLSRPSWRATSTSSGPRPGLLKSTRPLARSGFVITPDCAGAIPRQSKRRRSVQLAMGTRSLAPSFKTNACKSAQTMREKIR